MPIIVIASPKGGVGKTTTCILLASEIHRQGVEITAIDADPNQHFYYWCGKVGLQNVRSSNQDKIISDIDSASSLSPVVIVDLEGSTNMTMAYAVCKADIVIIPTQASDLDGREVMKIANFILNQSKLIGKDINKSVLFTKVSSAIITRIEKALIQDFENSGLNIFSTRVTEREAFKNVFSYKCFLHDLPATNKKEVASNEKALNISKSLSFEIAESLKTLEKNSLIEESK